MYDRDIIPAVQFNMKLNIESYNTYLYVSHPYLSTHKRTMYLWYRNSGARELWSNSVKIERCRYLESVQCKGACVSICKLPTQTFFTEDLGMPVTMTPNFEDLR